MEHGRIHCGSQQLRKPFTTGNTTVCLRGDTALHTSQAIPSTEKLAELMLYNFIGCWLGDSDTRLLRIAQGFDNEVALAT